VTDIDPSPILTKLRDSEYLIMMKRFLALALLVAGSVATQAALKPGAHLQPYTIKNTATGESYCQVCKYGPKSAKIVAFGKLDDAQFWADLKQLQSLQDKYEKLGVFAQVIDSKDTQAIQKAAKQNGVTFPVVVAEEPTWNDIYKVDGQSRVIYYARQDNKILWTNIGLDDKSTQQLAKKLAKSLKS
jgi:hypothetical protein